MYLNTHTLTIALLANRVAPRCYRHPKLNCTYLNKLWQQRFIQSHGHDKNENAFNLLRKQSYLSNSVSAPDSRGWLYILLIVTVNSDNLCCCLNCNLPHWLKHITIYMRAVCLYVFNVQLSFLSHAGIIRLYSAPSLFEKKKNIICTN